MVGEMIAPAIRAPIRLGAGLRGALVCSTLVMWTAQCSATTGPQSDPTARVVWHEDGNARLAPAADDSMAFFASSDHRVLAYDKLTGAPRWASNTDSDPRDFQPGDRLLVVGEFVIYPDFDVYAFRRKTGARAWKFSRPGGMGAGFYTPTSDGTRVYAGSQAGTLFALRVTDGSLAWEANVATEASITKVFSPVIDGDLVFASVQRSTTPFTGGIVAVDASTGILRWRREFTSVNPGGASGCNKRSAVSGDLVMVSAGDGRVYALNRNTGATVWVTDAPFELSGRDDIRPILVVGNTLLVGSTENLLVGLDIASGMRKWTTQPKLGSTLWEHATDGAIVYVFAGVSIAAINPVTGALVWRTTPLEVAEFSAPPAVQGSLLFAGGFQGYYALRK